MSKQSSIDWLIEQINQDYPEMTWAYKKECEKAKAMHREEILDAFVAGDERGTGEIPFNCEQYYNQTFE